MEISVIGLGKLGLPLAVVLAAKGYTVIGVDSDDIRVDQLNDDQTSPIGEPGVQDLLDLYFDRLGFTTDTEDAVHATDATFVIVPTPSMENGSYNLSPVLSVCREIGAALKTKDAYHLVVIVSTVMPEDTQMRIIPALETFSEKCCGEAFGVCYSPEFIALGEVVKGLTQPDFVLIGECDARAGDMLERLYQPVITRENTDFMTYSEPITPPVKRMSLNNAELTKIALNSFLTMKISFANALALLCDNLDGGDVDVVTGAVGLDQRIGYKYLKGGAPFGGPCLTRDNRALIEAGRRLRVELPLAAATDTVNQQVLGYIQMLAERGALDGSVCVLGLSYKLDTDWQEESLGVWLQNLLREAGQHVTNDITTATAIVLCLPDPKYRDLDFQPGQTVVDVWRVLEDVPDGVTLVALGRN